MRKFLDDIGVDPHYGTDDLPEYKDDHIIWIGEQLKYGFDSRDAWAVNDTMVALLYERLKMFEIVADRSAGIDLDDPVPTVYNLTLSRREWLRKLYALAEYVLQYEFNQKPPVDIMTDQLRDHWQQLSPIVGEERSYTYGRSYIYPGDAQNLFWDIWAKIHMYFWH